MTRILFLMAVILQLVACSEDEPTQESVGSQVDSDWCDNSRADYILAVDDMIDNRRVIWSTRRLINLTLKTLNSNRTGAVCFTKQELIRLHSLERDITIEEIERRVVDWQETCDEKKELETLSHVLSMQRYSPDDSFTLTLTTPDLDRVKVIRVYARVKCGGIKRSKVDPLAFSSILEGAWLSTDGHLQKNIRYDIVINFYRIYYTEGTTDDVEAQRFINEHPLDEMTSPILFARELIESVHPPAFRFYNEWDVDIDGVQDAMLSMLQDPSRPTRFQKVLYDLGYPLHLVHLYEYETHISNHRYQLAVQIARKYLGEPWITNAESDMIRYANKSGDYAISVERDGSRTKVYDLNDWR